MKYIITILLFLTAGPAFTQHTENRPNFIIFIGDDISWNDLGCYGHPAIRSPNIDKLAAQGIRFTNAYLTASSCSPSRTSIISGRYPHNTGAAELHTPLPADIPTFPGQLKKAGYYTASSGKWHMGPDAKKDFDLVIEEPHNTGGEQHWLEIVRDRPKDKPFFFWFASHDAHRDWQADDFGVPHDPADAVIPPYLADAPGTRRDLASYYNEIQRFDHFVGKVVEELTRQNAMENTLILIMADNGRPFPRCKTRVYDSGMKTPFIIVWPAGTGQKGAVSNSLLSVIDIAPTFLELAGLETGPTFQGISFAHVLSDPDAEHRRYVFSEHNWHDYEAYERMVRTKYFLYLANFRPQFSNQGPADSNTSPSYADLKAVRDRGALNAAQADVFIKPRPHEELFNCIDDPQQFVNVAVIDRYAPVLHELRGILQRWMQETGDDVPEHLTPSWYDPETGHSLDKPRVRGEMPGTASHATTNNNKGPY